MVKIRIPFKFNVHSFVNSLKTVLACLIGLIVTQLLELEQPQWVLISILIVMAAQYRLGGAIMKGYARLLATALGSSIAAAILFLFANHFLVVYTLLFLFIALFIYLASNSKDYSYAYSLGAVTMVIIVISDNPALHAAMNRTIEILIGVTIGVFVSRFVLPIQAKVLLYQNIALTMNDLKELYRSFIREDKSFSLKTKQKSNEEKIIKNFMQQLVLLKEACAESATIRKQRFRFVILVRLQRRLLRTIYMLHYTLRLSLKSFSKILVLPEFLALHQEIIKLMEDIEMKLRDKHYSIPAYDLELTYNNIIMKLRTLFDSYSFEEKNKIHAYIFCVGHIINLLNRTRNMVLEIQDPHPTLSHKWERK